MNVMMKNQVEVHIPAVVEIKPIMTMVIIIKVFWTMMIDMVIGHQDQDSLIKRLLEIVSI
jgi:hypothetical protein